MPGRKTSPRTASPSAAALRLAFKPVVRAAAGLLELEQSTSYGTPCLRVRGKSFTRMKEDGETLVVLVDLDSREILLRSQPHIFYLTDHYRDYPAVLVRLAAVSPARLSRLLVDAWERAAPKTLRVKHAAETSPAARRIRSR